MICPKLPPHDHLLERQLRSPEYVSILVLTSAAICAQDGCLYYCCSSPPGNLLRSLETDSEQEISVGSVGGGSVHYVVSRVASLLCRFIFPGLK